MIVFIHTTRSRRAADHIRAIQAAQSLSERPRTERDCAAHRVAPSTLASIFQEADWNTAPRRRQPSATFMMGRAMHDARRRSSAMPAPAMALVPRSRAGTHGVLHAVCRWVIHVKSPGMVVSKAAPPRLTSCSVPAKGPPHVVGSTAAPAVDRPALLGPSVPTLVRYPVLKARCR